ncbi:MULTISPECIES: hypothetical protein [unclassified Aurantimonas]|uniref:hypothetical protein n=1 Tax=unclassified Aurantimonas TaxID=2638230 RepID=UPI002E19C6B7|nr:MULTISPECIES: hypothetical protein [unclassified Aurantimonas]MEC5291559.1 hypothetical protein [Aurantimonas sp. C2-3-R2]MEC5412643.1 hypothetical protein [Aurantimonas sp. C2-4-R8]
MKISADFETRSPVDLRTRGAFVYFSAPDTRVLMCAYRIDDAPIRIWTFDQPPPLDLWAAIEAGATINAWNCQFETLGFDMLAAREGWPKPRYDRYVDTAAAAAAMALPRALGDAATVLGLDVQKDKDGMRLIRKFSMPRRARKGEDPAGLYWNEPQDHPEDWELFKRYCVRDVETEEAAAKRIVPLSAAEQELWLLDQKINRRGIRIDHQSATAAIALADKSKKALDAEMRIATGGYAGKCSEPGKLVDWMKAQGVTVESADKPTLEDLLHKPDLPDAVRRAVDLRLEAAKTSVSKLSAMLKRAGADGRIRGAFMYHAASTGRWTSVGVNFANLPRPRKEFETAALDPAGLFDAIRVAEPDWLKFLYGEDLGRPLHLLSDAIRGFIMAAPGHDLIQADYSGIEGAVAAWLAGETWKVKALHEIAADPSLPDMYRRMAAGIMNMSTDVITKKHPLRQSVGKTSELACFAAETQVLTDSGFKAIKEVLISDLLWDGVAWMKHSGLIERSARPVVDVDGIRVTPDHLIRTGPTWTPAGQLASNPALLGRALATGSASLPSQASTPGRRADFRPSSSSAFAVPILTGSRSATSGKGLVRAAINALCWRLQSRAKATSGTRTSRPMSHTAGASLTGFPLASSAATTQRTLATATTEVAASRFSGKTTNAPSWNTSSHSTGGTTPLWNLIARTWIEAMSPAISALSRGIRMLLTGGSTVTCRTKSPGFAAKSCTSVIVCDIALAGPRNRFTIRSDNGFLLAHNCGFGGGVPAFYTMAKSYGVDLDAIYPHVWEAASEQHREKAVKRFERELKAKKSRADQMTREAWIACEIIKHGWRETNPAITAGWKVCEQAIREAIQTPGRVVPALKCSYLVAQGFLWCRLPSGRCLAYATPRLKDQVWACRMGEDGEWLPSEVLDRDYAEAMAAKGLVKIEGETSPKATVCGVDGVTKKWVRFALYGGLIFQNAVQAIARDLLVNGMLKAEAAGYPIIGHVYDEMFCEVPRGTGDLAAFERLICELPDWARGVGDELDLPLTAGGWRGKRYRKD